MKNARLRLALGSLLGSFVVYGVISACSSMVGERAMKDADAQTRACSRWQVMVVDSKKASSITDLTKIYGTPFDMPADWEPFGTWGIDVIVRRCSN